MPYTKETSEATTSRSCLSVISYNVTTLKSSAQKVALVSALHHHGVDVAGLQECRASTDVVSDTEHYRRVCSRGRTGQYGCEVWLSKRARFDLTSIAVLCQEPRCACVTVSFTGCLVAIVSGHACHSYSPEDEIDEWWCRFAHLLHRLPKQAAPLLCLDANARFDLAAMEISLP